MKTKDLKIKAEIKKLFSDNGKVKAAVSLAIEDAFIIRGVRLIEGGRGLFVSMPSRRDADGDYKDICYPTNADTRALIQDTVVAAYEKALQERDNAGDGEAEGGGQA